LIFIPSVAVNIAPIDEVYKAGLIPKFTEFLNRLENVDFQVRLPWKLFSYYFLDLRFSGGSSLDINEYSMFAEVRTHSSDFRRGCVSADQQVAFIFER
jgi:hypothetical protein